MSDPSPPIPRLAYAPGFVAVREASLEEAPDLAVLRLPPLPRWIALAPLAAGLTFFGMAVGLDLFVVRDLLLGPTPRSSRSVSLVIIEAVVVTIAVALTGVAVYFSALSVAWLVRHPQLTRQVEASAGRLTFSQRAIWGRDDVRTWSADELGDLRVEPCGRTWTGKWRFRLRTDRLNLEIDAADQAFGREVERALRRELGLRGPWKTARDHR